MDDDDGMDVDDAHAAAIPRGSKRTRDREGDEGSVERPVMAKRVKSVSRRLSLHIQPIQRTNLCLLGGNRQTSCLHDEIGDVGEERYSQIVVVDVHALIYMSVCRRCCLHSMGKANGTGGFKAAVGSYRRLPELPKSHPSPLTNSPTHGVRIGLPRRC